VIRVEDLVSPIGLIAGNGSFPINFAENAKAAGLSVVAVAIIGEADPRLNDLVEQCKWLKVGEVGRAIDFLKKHGVKQAALAGGVKRIKLFGGFKPDLKAISIIARCRSIRDDALLREVSREMQNCGIEIFDGTIFLRKSVSQKGLLTKRALTEEEKVDARLGWEIAKELGRLDIGQTVIVHQRLVVAVEAIEGTDAAILRAGDLAGTTTRRKIGQGCVIVKLSKPQQDLRLDLPTVGLDTLEIAKKAGVSALVLEVGKTIILDVDKFIKRADENKIAVFVAGSVDDI
jgi:DUF1009 family protein